MILDIKTGKKIADYTRYQLSAYTMLDSEEVDFYEDPHLYFNAEGESLPSVTQILKATGFLPDYSGISDYYRIRGSKVHALTVYDDLNQIDDKDIAEDLMPFIKAWRAFKSEYKWITEQAEISMICTEYGYAGTIDRTGRFADRTIEASRCAVLLQPNGEHKLEVFKKDDYDKNIWLKALKQFLMNTAKEIPFL